MKVIGLTGPSGAGKGICCDYFSSQEIPCIDTDNVYHNLIKAPSPCTRELVNEFGESIINGRGGIDRKALAAIVFSDMSRERAAVLNRITHKYVREKTSRLLDKYKMKHCRAVVVDAPLLFEAGFDEMCDFCIAVLAPYELRLQRIIKRDRLTVNAAEARLAAQKADDYYSSQARYTVINDADKENTSEQLKSILIAEGLFL